MLKRVLIIPDVHFPFEDKKAWKLVLKLIKLFKPDLIIFLGDLLDCLSITSHPKGTDSYNVLLEEIDYANIKLDEIDKLSPKSKKVFIEGNHEVRINTYIRDKAPALHGLIKIHKLLKLADRKNWQWVPFSYGQSYRIFNSNLYARHKRIGSDPRACAKAAKTSLVYGDVHQIEEAYGACGSTGKVNVVFSPGWLGDKNYKVYDFLKSNPNWAHGVGIAYIDSKTKEFYHQIIRIIDGQCIFNGKLIK